MPPDATLSGLANLVGALCVFTGAGSIGSLAAVVAARRRFRRGTRAIVIAMLTVLIGALGLVLTRTEARPLVIVFAILPLAAGFALSWMDVR